MLQDNLLLQSRVKQSLGDGNNRLFPHFGKKLPFYAVQNPKSENLSWYINLILYTYQSKILYLLKQGHEDS